MHLDSKRTSTPKLVIKEANIIPVCLRNDQRHGSSSLFNTAELTAMEEERLRIEEEERKRQIIEANQEKYKQNIKQYKMKMEQIIENKKLHIEEKQKVKLKAKEFNQKIRESNIRRPMTSKTNSVNSKEERLSQPLEVYETFSFNQKELEEEKEETLKECNSSGVLKTNVLNLRENMDKIIKERITYERPKDQICNVHEEINKNLIGLKEFRKFGFVTNSEERPNNISKEEESKQQERSMQIVDEQNKKIRKDLQTQRYKKALRNLMIEKFKEKSIIIPNICSCGQLQRKLDTLLENKNVSVYSIINIECANNCIYYNNTTDFNKAITDIIQSVKSLNFDQFK